MVLTERRTGEHPAGSAGTTVLTTGQSARIQTVRGPTGELERCAVPDAPKGHPLNPFLPAKGCAACGRSSLPFPLPVKAAVRAST